jgi:hypothetical protein
VGAQKTPEQRGYLPLQIHLASKKSRTLLQLREDTRVRKTPLDKLLRVPAKSNTRRSPIRAVNKVPEPPEPANRAAARCPDRVIRQGCAERGPTNHSGNWGAGTSLLGPTGPDHAAPIHRRRHALPIELAARADDRTEILDGQPLESIICNRRLWQYPVGRFSNATPVWSNREHLPSTELSPCPAP